MAKRRNPLRLDPTRTTMIRRAWMRDVNARFTELKRAIRRYLVDQDMLGLTNNAPRFVFETDDKKVRAFNRWLKQQVDAGVLQASPTTGEPLGQKPWMYKYIDNAYMKGRISAYAQVKGGKQLFKSKDFYEGGREQFLNDAFNQPERASKLRMLYTRTYEDLKGVTQSMAAKMSRVLTSGVVAGDHPLEIARALTKTVSGIGMVRARMIARTETIAAHADAQLDGYEDLGLEEVSGDLEFTTSDDDGVCPICEDMEGDVYSIDDARGVIPVHPNCRCGWSPYFGEDDADIDDPTDPRYYATHNHRKDVRRWRSPSLNRQRSLRSRRRMTRSRSCTACS